MAYNILSVDDSATVRAVIGKTLRVAGLDVGEFLEAGNGREALDLLQGHWVDLVFADINMPVMNGLEMIDAMAEAGILQTVPVIVVSTEGSATRIEQLKSKGVVEYLRKPFTPESIREIVESVLGDSHGKR